MLLTEENKLLKQHCKKYYNTLFFTSIYYGFSIIIFGYFDLNINIIFNAFVNVLFGGLVSLIIEYFEDDSLNKKKITFTLFNFFLIFNLFWNLYLFFNFKMYFIYNLSNCLISLYYLSQNMMLLNMSISLKIKNQSITKKMDKIITDVKKFTPEQKDFFKQELLKQVNEIISLKNEFKKKKTN